MATNREKIFDAAIKLLSTQKYDKAVAELKKLADEDLKDVRVWQKLAETYLKTGQTRESLSAYERVGAVYTEQGFYHKALAIYKQMLRIDQNQPDVHLKLAEIYQSLGLPVESINHYQNVAAIYEQANRWRDALAIFKRMTDLDPENVSGRVKLAEIFYQQNMPDEGSKEYQRALEYLLNTQRYEEYLRWGERYTSLDPNAKDTALQLAKLYLQRGDARLALSKLQTLFMDNARDLTILGLIADAFLKMSQYAKAVSVYKEIARIHQESNEDAEAMRHWQLVLQLAPDDEEAQTALAAPLLLLQEDAISALPLMPMSMPEVAAEMPYELGAEHMQPVDDDDEHPTQHLYVPPTQSIAHTMQGNAVASTGMPVLGLPGTGIRSNTVVNNANPYTDIAVSSISGPNQSSKGSTQQYAAYTPPVRNEQVAKIMGETDVYVKYNLKDKAIEHLQAATTQFVGNIELLERLKNLCVEVGNTFKAQQTLQQLVSAGTQQGDLRTAMWQQELDAMAANAFADSFDAFTNNDDDVAEDIRFGDSAEGMAIAIDSVPEGSVPEQESFDDAFAPAASVGATQISAVAASAISSWDNVEPHYTPHGQPAAPSMASAPAEILSDFAEDELASFADTRTVSGMKNTAGLPDNDDDDPFASADSYQMQSKLSYDAFLSSIAPARERGDSVLEEDALLDETKRLTPQQKNAATQLIAKPAPLATASSSSAFATVAGTSTAAILPTATGMINPAASSILDVQSIDMDSLDGQSSVGSHVSNNAEVDVGDDELNALLRQLSAQYDEDSDPDATGKIDPVAFTPPAPTAMADDALQDAFASAAGISGAGFISGSGVSAPIWSIQRDDEQPTRLMEVIPEEHFNHVGAEADQTEYGKQDLLPSVDDVDDLALPANLHSQLERDFVEDTTVTMAIPHGAGGFFPAYTPPENKSPATVFDRPVPSSSLAVASVAITATPPTPATTTTTAKPVSRGRIERDFAHDPASMMYPDELDEAQFFLDQGIYDEAREVLSHLLRNVPDSLRVQFMLDLIDARENGLPDPQLPWEQQLLDEVTAVVKNIDAVNPVFAASPAAHIQNFDATFVAPMPFPVVQDVETANQRMPANGFDDDDDVFSDSPDRTQATSTVTQRLTAPAHIKAEMSEQIALRERDEQCENHYNIGIAYRGIGLYDDALQEFEHAIHSPAKYVEARYMMGVTYLDLVEFDKALLQFNYALASEAATQQQRAASEYQRAICLQALGRLAESFDAFRMARDLGAEADDIGMRMAALANEMHERGEDATLLQASALQNTATALDAAGLAAGLLGQSRRKNAGYA